MSAEKRAENADPGPNKEHFDALLKIREAKPLSLDITLSPFKANAFPSSLVIISFFLLFFALAHIFIRQFSRSLFSLFSSFLAPFSFGDSEFRCVINRIPLYCSENTNDRNAINFILFFPPPCHRSAIWKAPFIFSSEKNVFSFLFSHVLPLVHIFPSLLCCNIKIIYFILTRSLIFMSFMFVDTRSICTRSSCPLCPPHFIEFINYAPDMSITHKMNVLFLLPAICVYIRYINIFFIVRARKPVLLQKRKGEQRKNVAKMFENKMLAWTSDIYCVWIEFCVAVLWYIQTSTCT